MHPPLRQKAGRVALIVSVLWASAVLAQGKHHVPRPPIVPHFAVPPLVRLSGSLHLPEEKGAPVHSLLVFIHDTKWNFWLTRVDTLSGTNYGWLVLANLFPRELHFSGPEELLGPLQRPEMASKPLTVEGRLYASDRMLAVTAVGDAMEQPQ